MRTYINTFCIITLILSGICVAQNKTQSDLANREKRRQELRLKKNIAKATVGWLHEQKTSDRLESEQQIDLLLEQDKPSVKSYFVAAKAANLCGNDQKAISILEDVIVKHADAKAPGVDLPVKILGRFWLATIAKQSGDIAKAKSAYDLILKDIDGIASKEYLAMVCNLYLSEIASEHLNKKDKALAKLEKAMQIKRPAQKEWAGLYDIYIDWIKYEKNKNTQNANKANESLIADPEKIAITNAMGASQLFLVGLTDYPLSDYIHDETQSVIFDNVSEQAIKSKASSIDKNLSRLVIGYVKEKAKKHTDAEKYYSDLFKENSYFSPIAGVSLARCKKDKNKNTEAENILEEMKIKYPGYNTAIAELKKNPRAFAPQY
jgi:hypothetical protein